MRRLLALFLRPDGTPWAHASVPLTLSGSYTPTEHYSKAFIPAVTDANGVWGVLDSAGLFTAGVLAWPNDEGDESSSYTVRVPSGREYTGLSFPQGDGSDLQLSALIAMGGDASDPQNASILAYVDSITLSWLGAWSAVTSYLVHDVVSRLGSTYRSLTSNLNQAPETNADDWELLAQKGGLGDPGPQGAAATIVAGTTTTGAPGTDAQVVNSGTSGAAVFDFTIPRGATGLQGAANDTYDFSTRVIGRPDASEEIIGHVTARDFSLPVDLADSWLKADVAATAQAVCTVWKNGGQIGTITIAASGTTGTFALSGGASFAKATHDIFQVLAPSTQDATLAGIKLTIIGTTV